MHAVCCTSKEKKAPFQNRSACFFLMELGFLSFPALLTFILFFITASKLKTKSKNSNQNLPPGPSKMPFFGNIHNLAGSLPHRKLRDLAKKYGTAFGEKCRDQREFISTVSEVMDASGGFSVSDTFPSLTWLHVLSGERSRLEKTHRKIDKMLEDIIGVHKASKERRERGDSKAEEDLVDVLLRIQEGDSLAIPLTIENIKAVVS
ncbi:hypothetical protein RJ641_000515, partial [Dillenia turbinata]